MFKKTLPITLSIVLILAPSCLVAGRHSKKNNSTQQNAMNQRLTNQNAMNQRPTNNQQTMNQNAMNQQNTNQYTMNQRPTNSQQTMNQNSMNQRPTNSQQTMNQNSMNQRPTNNQQTMNQNSMNQQNTNQYTMNQRPTNNQQTMNQNSMNQQSMNQRPTNNQQTTNQNSMNQNSMNQNSMNQNSMNQHSMNQHSMNQQTTNHNDSINEQQCSLRCNMNKLWTDHVLWTRQFIISSVAGLQDKDAVVQRLLHNQDEIGNAIAPFYGAEAGRELARLLKKHITIYADLVKAALMHNTDEVNNLYTQWRMNAAELGAFLSKANPYWNQQQMTDMFNEHLRLTAIELQLRMNSDWVADIANFDEIFKQALMMAKNLADGIAQQFPASF